jgi:hypothetical protein
MNPQNLPVVSYIFEVGADDRVFDSLLLAGPLLLGIIIVLNRSLFTELLAFGYIAIFVVYTVYRGITE